MKKIYSLIIATLIFSINVKAQVPNFTWAKQLGGTNTDNISPNSSVVDINGNVFTSGAFSGTADFDPGAGTFNMTSLGSTDIFVSKLDANGNFVWAKQIGAAGVDQAFGITLDGNGNVITTGQFQGTVDFDPGAGAFNMIAVAAGGDLFISKLDGSGNFVWAKRMGNATGMFGLSIKADAGNNILTTGTFYNTVDFDPGAGTFNMTSVGVTDAFISKLDAAGNFVWAKQLGGTSNDEVGQISTDASSNVFLTGYFYGTSDFDPGAGTFNMTSFGVSDIYISKLDASGNFVWAKQMGGTATDRGFAIAVDGIGNVYTTGFYIGTGDFDPGVGTYTLTGSGVYEHFLSKLNSAGNFVWAKQFTGSPNQQAGYSIAVDGVGNVYSTGYFEGTTDFDPGAGTFTLTSAGLSDPFISKLNSSGNFIWAGQLAGTGADYGFYLGLDANNNIYVAGQFDATTDFNAGVGVFNITTFGNIDVYIAKYCQSPDQPAVVNGSTSVCAGSSPIYTITTIPGATSYTWVLPGGWGGAGTSNTINPTTGSSGTISVAGINSCGTGLSQTISITVNPLPTINASTSNSLLCSGQTATITASGASTYTFNPGGAGTSISVSPTITATYSITGTDANGCTNTTAFTQSVSACTGLSTVALAKEEINIYPNPTSGPLIIVNDSEGSVLVQIFNTLGSLIYSIETKETEIDLSKQPNGIYFVRIGSVTKKIIKE